MLTVQGMNKAFDGRAVLDDWSLQAEHGQARFLTGPNGVGKTTALRCLAGIERCEASVFALDGRPCSPSSPRHWRSFYSIVDDFTWFPDLTLRDHLALLGHDEQIDGALEALDISPLIDRRIASLSSGQAQRAALATTAVRDWDVLLLDEPEQRLDGDGVHRLADLLKAFLEQGRIVIASTHLPELIDLVGGSEVPWRSAAA